MSRPDIAGFPVNYNSRMNEDPFSNMPADPRNPYGSKSPTVWAGGRQRPVISEGESRMYMAGAAGVAGGIFASGFIKVGNRRVWDTYTDVVKSAEILSPGHLATTFRLGEMLSPFENMDKRQVWSGNLWASPQRQEYLKTLLGGDIYSKHYGEISKHGLALKSGRLYTGRGTQIPGTYSKLRTKGALGPAEFYKHYARGIGVKGSLEGLAFTESQEFLPIGARSKGQAYWRYGRGIGASLVARLLKVSPTEIGEMPMFKDAFRGAKGKYGPGLKETGAYKGFRKIFPKIEPGRGMSTIGKYLTRRVLPAAALLKGFQYVDYLTDHAITGGVLDAYAGVKIGKAKAMETLGLTDYAKRQEEIAPGSTSLLGLSAVPFGGALIGFGAYGARMLATARAKAQAGPGVRNVAATVAEQFKEKNFKPFFADKIVGDDHWFSQMFKTKRTLASALRRTGAYAGLAAIAPFIPGALIGTDESEDLEAIYSGEEEVAIRKGRWWEAGRCNTSESLIFLDSLNYKYAKEIEIGDTLLGSDGRIHNIKNVYTRHHKGYVLKLKTVLDRNIETGLTDNHMVQVLKEKDDYGNHIDKEKRTEEFIEAGLIDVGDYVEVPIPHLKEGLLEIKSSNFIKVGLYLEEEGYLYTVQKKRFGEGVQKSCGKRIPDTIVLNEDIGRLFGYFIAEGSLSFTSKNIPHMIETVHAKHETWIIDDIVSICEKEFGTAPTIRFKTTGAKSKEGCWIVRICNNLLARIFFELFYSSDRAVDKFIPDAFLDATNDFKLALVEAYWRGDGHLHSKSTGRRVISSCRKQFADFVQVIMLSNGICPTIPKMQVNGYRGKYTVRWTPGTEYKNVQGFQWINGKLYTRIFSIEEEEYDDIVYDFEIDHKDHLIVNGTFLVHNSPWEGGRIQYFRQHFIPTYLSAAKPKALYGSEERKWNLDPWLPWNLPGYLADPYQWEKEHYYEFPFPMTSPAGEDIPLIGPLIAGTIGKLIKPAQLMHTEEWMTPATGANQLFNYPGSLEEDEQGGYYPIEGARGELQGYGYYGASGPGFGGQSQVKRLAPGFGQMPAYELGELPPGMPVDPYSPTQIFGEQSYRFTEMAGLSGYTATVFKGMLTGTDEFYNQSERLETARRATGIERAYWDMQIGGGFLSTELFRRLFPHERRIPTYNPIRNMMPDWLPGAGERSPDFQHGFAFGTTLEGDIRLPGRGLAALYPELEGVDPGDYSALWRYKILSDVAPYTDRTKFYRKTVKAMRKQGLFSEEEEAMYQTIQEQLKAKKEFKTFGRDQFTNQPVETRKVTVTKVLGPGEFEVKEMPGVKISMAGLKTSKAAYSRLELKEHNELTQEEADRRGMRRKASAQARVGRMGLTPGEQLEIDLTGEYSSTKSQQPQMRAVVRNAEGQNINRVLLEAGLAEYDAPSTGALAGQIKYSPFERVVGTYWEGLMNVMDNPLEYLTPISPYSKFLAGKNRTAVERYAAEEAYGTASAFWDRPWENFLRPALLMTGYKYFGMTELPEHIQARNDIEEYFDKLKYIKYTRLQRIAADEGNIESAKEYEQIRRKTAFGADPYGNPLNALIALQRRDKPYFDEFVNAQTESEREQIMHMMPEHERHLIKARWNMQMLSQIYAERKVKGSLTKEQYAIAESIQKERLAEGQETGLIAQKAYKAYQAVAGSDAVTYADYQRERELIDYFEGQKPLPGSDFVGWHPQVDLEDVKLKVVKNAGMDIHDFNLWESRERTLPRKPYINEDSLAEIMDASQYTSSGEVKTILHDLLGSYGLENVNITVDEIQSRNARNRINLDITKDTLQQSFETAHNEGWI